jgi:hypothetical protein
MNAVTDKPALAGEIVDAVRRTVGSGPVALHEPRFAGNEWAYLKECLDSTYVSSVGKFVDRFEAQLADLTGAKFAIAVMNGTAALQVALQLMGVGRDDEVLVPALTFAATAAAVVHCAAVPISWIATSVISAWIRLPCGNICETSRMFAPVSASTARPAA